MVAQVELTLGDRIGSTTRREGIADLDRIAGSLVGRSQKDRIAALGLEDKAGLPLTDHRVHDAALVRKLLPLAEWQFILCIQGDAIADILRARAVVIPEPEQVGITIAAVTALADRSEGVIEAVRPGIATQEIQAVVVALIDLRCSES